MNRLLGWLSKHKSGAYTTSFLLMVLSGVPLYLAAKSGSIPGMLIFLGIFVSGNILALLIR